MILEVLFRFMTAGVIGSSISTAIYLWWFRAFGFSSGVEVWRKNRLTKTVIILALKTISLPQA